MKLVFMALFAIAFFSCNNSSTTASGKDSTVVTTTSTDPAKPTVTADTAREEYCYITAIEKVKDSIFIKADYVQYFTGKNVVEEAKKRHRADTSFDKSGKIEDIFVPDDYFIVNDDKQLRRLYLPGDAPIKMESEFVTDKTKDINNYKYLAGHFNNSLFMLTVKNNRIEAVKEIFLP